MEDATSKEAAVSIAEAKVASLEAEIKSTEAKASEYYEAIQAEINE